MTRVININSGEKYDICIMRPSKWGNPFRIGLHGTREEVIEKHLDYILEFPELLFFLHELKGKVLACCCKPLPCHGDNLVNLINLGAWT